MCKEILIKNFTRAIVDGSAAIFAGAGLGHASGFPDWRNLIRHFASEISLDVDKEHDLSEVLQYYCNHQSGNRATISETILNIFIPENTPNENVDIITRLPIKTYWTTNYDHLIEDGLKANNRKADVKKTEEDLSLQYYYSDAVVYKMHGDKTNSNRTVILRDDYESYRYDRKLFKASLKSDLLSKTFLFVGFSFEDPNINYILGRLRILVGEQPRNHFAFFKKINCEGQDADEDLKYKKIKQDLKIDDLKRFGIRAVLVDEYDEITEILRKIEKEYLKRNVFISGSMSDFSNDWTIDKTNHFCYLLTEKLIENENKIISGFGKHVGSLIINGALHAIRVSKYKRMENHLSLWPFPIEDNVKLSAEMSTKYRKEMIRNSGISIFIFGNKIKNGETVIADGMLEEFEIARDNGNTIIPVGSTGFAASEISRIIKDEIENYSYLENSLDILENSRNIEELVDTIMEIVKASDI